jgi:hypothetical protein
MSKARSPSILRLHHVLGRNKTCHLLTDEKGSQLGVHIYIDDALQAAHLQGSTHLTLTAEEFEMDIQISAYRGIE